MGGLPHWGLGAAQVTRQNTKIQAPTLSTGQHQSTALQKPSQKLVSGNAWSAWGGRPRNESGPLKQAKNVVLLYET